MAHQQMFDDDDPLLAQVRALALALPEADEKVSHGRPAFFTKKVFCTMPVSGWAGQPGFGSGVQGIESPVVMPGPKTAGKFPGPLEATLTKSTAQPFAGGAGMRHAQLS